MGLGKLLASFVVAAALILLVCGQESTPAAPAEERNFDAFTKKRDNCTEKCMGAGQPRFKDDEPGTYGKKNIKKKCMDVDGYAWHIRSECEVECLGGKDKLVDNQNCEAAEKKENPESRILFTKPKEEEKQ